MILYNPSHGSILPGALTCQPSCVLSFPSSVEVDDSWLNGGSGVGDGSSAIKAALGEYFERRHFYMEVMSNVVGNINHSLTSVEAEKFVDAFSQTNGDDLSSAQLFSHVYNLTKVFRTSDFSICHIPTACISLNYHKIESESAIYPLRDTCGCSFHWCFEDAGFGAIKEYLERQFLSRFWLTRECQGLIAGHDVLDALSKSRAKALYEALHKSGELAVIDISDPDYPGSCILTVYGQKNKRRHVQYCAGMSYAKTLVAALEKSIYELWQTYRFIDLFCATERTIDDVKDPYLKHFLNCNTYETYKEIITIKPRSMIVSESRAAFSFSGLLATLKVRQVDGYLYVDSFDFDNDLYYFCKFISPDFFLHMNNSRGINTRNKYSQSFVAQMVAERKNMMVPFP